MWNNRIANLVTRFGAIPRNNVVKYLGTLIGSFGAYEVEIEYLRLKNEEILT